MADHAAVVSDFRVGRVLSRSFSTLFRNFASFGLLALVISAPTYVYAILAGPGDMPAPLDEVIYLPQFGTRELVAGIVDFLLGYFIVAALVYGTIQDLKHRRAGLGECFSKGVALVLPALGVAVVMILILALVLLATFLPGFMILGHLIETIRSDMLALLVIVFFLALLTPAIYVWVLFWVAIPVAVIERRGLGSFRRSAALTKGSRWRIFFLLLLLAVIAIGVTLILDTVGDAIIIAELASGGNASSAYFTGQVTADWILSAVLSALSAVIAAVTYHDLRVAREGVDTDQIAAVFD